MDAKVWNRADSILPATQMMTGRLVLLAVLPVALLQACGGASSELDEGAPYTPRQLMERFEAMTGDPLVPGEVLDLRRLGGGRSISLTTTKAARGKYGEFSFVVEIEAPHGRPSLSVIGPPPANVDSNGIYWQYEVPERGRDLTPFWGAIKSRGNVKLQWFSARKIADRRWHRLDAVLMSLKPT